MRCFLQAFFSDADKFPPEELQKHQGADGEAVSKKAELACTRSRHSFPGFMHESMMS